MAALPSQVVRAMHVGFLLLLGFGLLANLRAQLAAGKVWFWTLGGLGFLTGLYNWVEYCAADPPQRLPDHRSTSSSARC